MSELETITAPWTQEQVDLLNKVQGVGWLHPFTCPGETAVCPKRELTATLDGWVCACGRYRQEWAFVIPAEIVTMLQQED